MIRLHYFVIPALVRQVRKKGKIKVAFMAINVPMWKYDSLYRAMQSCGWIQPVVVSTMRAEKTHDEMLQDQNEMEAFFSGHEFIKGYNEENRSWINLADTFAPDIIFYTQPYEGIIARELDIGKIPALYCYMAYGFPTITEDWCYDAKLHRLAWKWFLPNDYELQQVKKRSYCKGRNACVVGDLVGDMFSKAVPTHIWSEAADRKRVIWAPHYSIGDSNLLQFSNFLEIADEMEVLRDQFCKEICFAFKPHPLLKMKLYAHQSWGQSKTDAYYDRWRSGRNSFIAEGGYMDLFSGSNGLVHDCASFTIEYLYTKKPTLYLSKPGHESCLNQIALQALDVHYKGAGVKAVADFLNDVIIGKNDPLMEARSEFFDHYLRKVNGNSAADNIIHELSRCLRS